MWHHLIVDNPATFVATAASIHKGILALLATTQNPEVAAFSYIDQETGSEHYYFSPAAELVALSLGASPCEKPSILGLGFVAGDTRAWQLLFPGETPKRI